MKRRIPLIMTALLMVTLGFISAGMAIDDPREETYFEGYVTDADTGDPVLEAIVTVYSSRYSYSLSVDQDGYYRVDVSGDQTYYIYAEAMGYEKGYAEEELPQGESRQVDFELVPDNTTGTIFGTVYDEETEDGLGADVYVQNQETGWWDYRSTDRLGGFRFEVNPGPYVLYVDSHDDQYEDHISDTFDVGEGEEVEMNIGLGKIQQMVHGFVTDERGEPVKGAYVSLESVPTEDSDWGWYYYDYTDSDGEYWMYPQPGKYWIDCNANLLEPYQDVIEIEEGEEVRYDIEMEPAIPSLLYRLIRFILDLIPQTY